MPSVWGGQCGCRNLLGVSARGVYLDQSMGMWRSRTFSCLNLVALVHTAKVERWVIFDVGGLFLLVRFFFGTLGSWWLSLVLYAVLSETLRVAARTMVGGWVYGY